MSSDPLLRGHAPSENTTDRSQHPRFQDRTKRCVLQCGRPHAEDSIEHYSRCPVVVGFSRQTLRLPEHFTDSILAFFGLGEVGNDEHYTLQLLAVYAAYSATNASRMSRGSVGDGFANRNELLLQYAKQGVFNHPRSARVLAEVLRRPYVKRRRPNEAAQCATSLG